MIDGEFVTNPFSAAQKAAEGEETGSFTLSVCAYRGNQALFYVLGDQYAFSSQMVAFSSSPSGMLDTRCLSFLTDSILHLEGQEALLKIKNKGKRYGGQSAPLSENEESGLFRRFLCSCLLFPLLVILAFFIAVNLARGKKNRRLKLIWGKSS